MSIIPASRLSRSDLCRLSNNLGRWKRPLSQPADAVQDTLHRHLIGAVNRSLASLGEKIAELDSLAPVMSAGGVCGD